ncbi:MAG: sigma-70 family RNA polymerase sigma factor [Veillonellales bacterium]
MELVDLVQQAQAGDEAAFTTICRRFEGLVKKQARQPHLRTIAEDAEAEAWLAVVQAVKTYRPSVGVPVAGYIESKIKYALWNLFKCQRRNWQREVLLSDREDRKEGGLSLELIPDSRNVAQEAENHWLEREMRQAIEELPVRQRQVVVLALLGDSSLTALARQLDVTVQAVHNLKQRGLTRLKRRFSGMYESERG